MRFFKLSVLFLCGLFLFSGSALAYTINGTTQVGLIDTLEASTTLSSYGYFQELAWIQNEGVLGPGYFFPETNKYNVNGSMWTPTDQDSDTFALALSGTPEYYFIKVGVGTAVFDPLRLYHNEISMAYAVINTAEWPDTVNIGSVSHLGEINGNGAPVPEPATMMLLGFGLIGLAGLRRKKFFKKS